MLRNQSLLNDLNVFWANEGLFNGVAGATLYSDSMPISKWFYVLVGSTSTNLLEAYTTKGSMPTRVMGWLSTQTLSDAHSIQLMYSATSFTVSPT